MLCTFNGWQLAIILCSAVVTSIEYHNKSALAVLTPAASLGTKLHEAAQFAVTLLLDGTRREVRIKVGEDPHQIASDFCNKEGLDTSSCEVLAQR